MNELDTLKAALSRLASGTATQEDQQAIHHAFLTGQIVLAIGERAVAFGGDVTDAVIVTGDDNVVMPLKGASAEAVKASFTAFFPPRLYQLRPVVSDFMGREKELALLTEVVRKGRERTVLVQGMPGVGKTELTLRLAEAVKVDYPDAHIYLDLRGASAEPLAVPEAMAYVIRSFVPTAQLPHREDELTSLYRSILEGKRALLVMDNAGCADQVRLLVPPPTCLLLMTSRQDFSFPGMHAVRLETLPLQDACHLLLSIAPRLTGYEGWVAHLCGHLPLALRVAGSFLARRADVQPATYVGWLSDARKRLVRLHEVEASIQLSYDLMDESWRRQWRALAVFQSSFNLRAAAAVWNLPEELALDAMGNLLGYSLVEWNDLTARYRLHDLLQLYAHACGDEDEQAEVRRRHTLHYLLTAEAIAPELMGKDQLNLLMQLETEHDNFRAAFQWCREHDCEMGLRLAEALSWFWIVRGYYTEGFVWLIWFLDRIDSPDPGLLARALLAKGRMLWRQGRYEEAVAPCEASLSAFQELGDTMWIAHAHSDLGRVYGALGGVDHNMLDQAWDHYQMAWELFNALGNDYEDSRKETGKAFACNGLGTVARQRGDYKGKQHDYKGRAEDYKLALEKLTQALDMRAELGDERGIAVSLFNLGDLAFSQGDLVLARSRYVECILIQESLKEYRALSLTLAAFARLAAVNESWKRAAFLWSAAKALCDRIGVPSLIGKYEKLGQYFADKEADIRTHLGDGQFEEIFVDGSAMPLEQAIGYALQED